MSRGRPRKYDPSIPVHVDQRKLPKGVYWDARYRAWYGKGGRKLSDHTATLAQLHALVSDLSPKASATLGWLMTEFESSTVYKGLAPATQRYYGNAQSATREIETLKGPLHALPRTWLSPPVFRVALDKIIQEGTPAKANMILRYVRRLFSWAIEFGHATTNPARGVKQADEKGDFKMPERPDMARVIEFARARGALKAHTKGSVSPYLWAFIVVGYRCRLRGVEVCTLTDAHIDDVGIITNRRKGSRDNHVVWNPELREAVDAARAYRAQVWGPKLDAQGRTKRAGRATPMRPEDRPLFVTQSGDPLTKDTLDSAWDRLMRAAIEAKVITDAQRFTPHGLKHRGITDSEDKASGGHATEKMRQRYDHELKQVKPAGE